MLKYFTYNISDFKGYRYTVEQSNLKCFEKIDYTGIKIVRSSTYFIHYEIDIQLVRKLKLKQISELIRPNSTEDRILQLLERSSEVDKDIIYPNPNSYLFTSAYNGSAGANFTNGLVIT